MANNQESVTLPSSLPPPPTSPEQAGAQATGGGGRSSTSIGSGSAADPASASGPSPGPAPAPAPDPSPGPAPAPAAEAYEANAGGGGDGQGPNDLGECPSYPWASDHPPRPASSKDRISTTCCEKAVILFKSRYHSWPSGYLPRDGGDPEV
eukprot:CAMPEP_0119536650 /NCGR_PEP_ID=MMETSP1344-20130328/49451_1 /TAXON_ID=236787 /ORGANISM="Florenciella parvula, Strain CCMP2471" /LENGTH=150 /DNA_ID=CAMNT_0007578785 /DNA_START=117 /DNA_END=566 /DNA_ORIENTATION=-